MPSFRACSCAIKPPRPPYPSGYFPPMHRANSAPPPAPPLQGLVTSGQLRGGEEWLANPALPEDVVRDSMPGGAQEGEWGWGCW
jgi:hypothetical protein